MSRSTDQIEREVEMTRANVEETVEALKDKMTVGEIFDEASHYLRSTELMSNLSAHARANPIPLVLIGVGLAWLMSGRGQPSIHLPSWGGRRSDEGDYYDDTDEDLFGYDAAGGARRGSGRAHSPYGAGRSGGYDSGGTSRNYGAARERSLSERASEALSGVGETASGIAGGVRSAAGSAAAAASRVGETVSSTASDVAGGVSSAASAVTGGASAAADALSGGARYAADAAGSAAHYVGETAAEAYYRTRRGAYYAGRRARGTFLDVLEEEPLVLGALGLAVGAAIGAVLPPTETEDRYLGETRDRLRRDAEEAARALAEKGREVAGEAYESARSEYAADDGAATIADKVERVAKAAVGTVKEEVQGLVGGGSKQPAGGRAAPTGTTASGTMASGRAASLQGSSSPGGGSTGAGKASPSSGTTTGGTAPRKG